MVNQNKQQQKTVTIASLKKYYQDSLIHILILITFIDLFVSIISVFVTTMVPTHIGIIVIILYVISVRARSPKVETEKNSYYHPRNDLN